MPNISTVSSAKIVLPKTPSTRNILTKMDDLGYFASLERLEGESLTNFQHRLKTVYTKMANSSLQGLVDAITRELSLGHENLITVRSDRDLKLDIGPEIISISGASQYDTVDIIDVDIDGYWNFPTIGKVVSGLNNVSGIVASSTSNFVGLPAALLEEQSSYIEELNEIVPPSTSFRLGYYLNGMMLQGTVLSGSIFFTDDVTFAKQVSGTPMADGEWSVDTNINAITSYSLPPGPVRLVYTYNILTSGRSMNLVGNGAKVINLFHSDVQSMLFLNSGIGATGQDFIDELRNRDRSFWGK